MNLKESQVNTIVYKKDGQEPEERTIIPTYIPFHNVRAIDVGGMTSDEVAEMLDMITEYQQYYSNYIKGAINFENWIQMSKNKVVIPKWRSFKPTSIVEIK